MSTMNTFMPGAQQVRSFARKEVLLYKHRCAGPSRDFVAQAGESFGADFTVPQVPAVPEPVAVTNRTTTFLCSFPAAAAAFKAWGKYAPLVLLAALFQLTMGVASAVDTVPPTITSIVRGTPSAQTIRTNTTVFTVTFSEAVSNVTAEFFSVTTTSGTATGAVASITGGPAVYQVTVTNNASVGDFRLDMVPGPLVAGTTPTLFASGTGSPVSLAFDSAGNLYVGNYHGGTVHKVTSDGSVTNFASGLNTPAGLAFDGAGNLYVGHITGGTVSKVTSGGSVTNFASGVIDPNGLAFDTAGNLYAANYGANTVSKVTTNGTVSTFASGFNGPYALAFDATGNLYVANFSGNTVSKVTSGGAVSTFASGFSNPYALAFDRASQLYVANYSGDNVSRVLPAQITDLAGNGVSNAPYTGDQSYTYRLNSSPTDIALSSTSSRGSASTVIGTLSTTDADGADSHTYSLVSGTGDTDNASFTISGGTLSVGASVLAAGSYSVRIQTDDSNGGIYAEAFTITVDLTAPSIVSIVRGTPSAQVIRTNTTVFTVTFSEAVTSVTPEFFTVTTVSGTAAGAVASITGGPSSYQVTVTNNGAVGDFRLDVGPGILRAGTAPTLFASGFDGPYGLAFDAAGNLYVANNGNNTVSMVTTNGTVSQFATGFNAPWGLAFDSAGHLYVANGDANTVSKVTPDGTNTTFASGFNVPFGLAFDAAGNLYVANVGDHTVSQITPTSTNHSFASDVYIPYGLAIDAAGNLYVAKFLDNTVIKVTSGGSVTDFASGFSNPVGLAFDATGHLYVANSGNNTVSRLALAQITDLAGNGVSNAPYTGGESYTYSLNNSPTDVALSSTNGSGSAHTAIGTFSTTDADGGDAFTYTLVSGVGDTDNGSFTIIDGVLKVGSTNLASGTYSVRVQVNDGQGGTYARVFSITLDGTAPSILSIVRGTPSAQVIQTNTTVFTVTFSESVTNVTPEFFTVTTVSGTATGTVASITGGPSVYEVTVTNNASAGDFRLDVGPPVSAPTTFASGFSSPVGLAFDAAGILYVANSGDDTVSKVTSDGAVTTFASGFSMPNGLVFDAAGNLYVANFGNDTVSKVTSGGTVTNFASGFSMHAGLAFDSAGHLYVANAGDDTVSKVTSGGSVTTFATNFNQPGGLAFDAAGNLYVANFVGNTVSKVTSGGTVSTFATGFSSPFGLAFDAAGNLYVANNGNNTVSKVTTNGTVSQFAAGFNGPAGLAFDAAGTLYVANPGDNTVSKVASPAQITDLVGNGVTGLPYINGESYTYNGNTAPTGLAFNVSTNSGAANTAIGTFSTTDADGTNTFTYSLVSGAGDTNNADFVIVGGTLKVGSTPLASGTYSVRVQTSDGQGGTYTEVFSITILDTTAPGIVSIVRGTPSAQRITAGTAVFTARFSEAVTNVSAGSFSVTTVSGTAAGAVASVTGGPSVYQVTVTNNAGLGEFRLDVVANDITDLAGHSLTGVPYTGGQSYIFYVNSSPTDVALSSTSSRGAANSAVGTFSTTDVDGGDAFTYTLVSGTGDTDNASFTIVNGVLKVGSTNLTSGTYSVRVQVADGQGGTYAKVFSITVDLTAPTVVSIVRGAPSEQVVTTNTTVFTVTFSEAVTNLTADFFTVTTVNGTVAAAVAHIAGGPAVYEVTVTNNVHNGEFRLDVVQPAAATTIFASGFNGPTGLAFDAAGDLYVANYGSSIVNKVTGDGSVTTFASGFVNPIGLAFDAAGNLYAANESGHSVSKVTGGGAVSRFASVSRSPFGLAFDAAGNLYVASFQSNTVSKVTSGGGVSPFASGFSRPYGLAFDAAGDLYVANAGSNTVSRVDSNGNVTLFASGFSGPTGLAFDAAGNLYVANRGSNTVSMVDTNGTVTLFASGFDSPEGLAFDAAGNFYVANAGGNTVIRFGSPQITDLAGNAATNATYAGGESYIYTNVPPADILLASETIVTLTSSNAFAGTLTAMDLNGTDRHTYTLVSGDGDTNNASFLILSNTLWVGHAELEEGDYSVRIQADDGHGGTYARAFTVTVEAGLPFGIVTLSSPTTYLRRKPPVKVDAHAILVDGGRRHFAGGRLTASIISNALPGDNLAVFHQGTDASLIGLVGNDVFYGGTVCAEMIPGANHEQPLVFNLNSNATPAAIQGLVRSVSFVTTNKDTRPRTVELLLTDRRDNAGFPGRKTIAIDRAPNDINTGSGTNLASLPRGIFNGLIMRTNDILPERSGYFRIKVSSSLSYSGYFVVGGKRTAISGQFNQDGHSAKVTKRGAHAIEFELVPETDQVRGTLTSYKGGGWSSELLGHRASDMDSEQAGQIVGAYTLSLPGSADPAIASAGNGFATLTVTARGDVKFRGRLADGQVWSRSVLVSSNGFWPVCVSLDRKKGVLIGWLRLDGSETGGITGTLTWIKPRTSFYPNGFAAELDVTSSRFTPIRADAPALSWTEGEVQLYGGNLPDAVINEILLTPTAKLLATQGPIQKLKLTTNPRTGMISGQFFHPVSRRATRYYGVLLQDHDMGSGYFLGLNQGGLLRLMPPADDSFHTDGE